MAAASRNVMVCSAVRAWTAKPVPRPLRFSGLRREPRHKRRSACRRSRRSPDNCRRTDSGRNISAAPAGYRAVPGRYIRQRCARPAPAHPRGLLSRPGGSSGLCAYGFTGIMSPGNPIYLRRRRGRVMDGSRLRCLRGPEPRALRSRCRSPRYSRASNPRAGENGRATRNRS